MLKALFIPLLLASSLAAEEGSRDLRLLEIKGDIEIQSKDGVWESIPEETVSVPLEEGETVKTGAGAEATLQLDQENTIELGENTEFELSSTRLAWTKFKLKTGKIFAKIEEKLEQKRRRMMINTTTAVLAVRGTEFLVEETEAGTGGMAVFEGQVELSPDEKTDAPRVFVKADQEIDLNFKKEMPRARALKRFAAHKRHMLMMRKKHARLKAQWRKLPLERRRAIRSKIQHRTNQRRKEMEKRRQRRQERRQP